MSIAELGNSPYILLNSYQRESKSKFAEKSTYIGSWENDRDVKLAVETLCEGGVVGGQMWGVYGLWVDATQEQAIKHVHEDIKQLPPAKSRTMSTMMSTPDLASILDIDNIHPNIRYLFYDLKNVQERVGAICHLRLPVRPDSIIEHNIPPILYENDGTQDYIQNLDPFGHDHMERFIRELKRNGVDYVGVTSMNRSGVMPEITDFNTAKRFVKETRVPVLLSDPLHQQEKFRGSFTILHAGQLKAAREGSVPIELMDVILELTRFSPKERIDRSNMKKSKYNQIDFAKLFGKITDPRLIRAEILLHLKGHSSETLEWVNRTIEVIDKLS